MKACNRKILELFYNAKHTGRISKPDAVARVGEDDEGLVIEITWRVIGGVIADAKFRAFANPNAIAITSLMVDNIIGKNVDEAILIGEDVIIDNLDEFRPEYLEAYDMVRACINEAYNNYLKRQSRKSEEEIEDFDYEAYIASHEAEDGEEFDIKQLQLQLQSNTTHSRRGRPKKEIDPNAVVEVGEKRGRGRPRKEIDPNAIIEVGVKRGRGRPRKIVEEAEEVVETVKRGRGRPRKEVDPSIVVEIGEKRGRGRPRKVVDKDEIVEVEGEKRGRGRPRKIVDKTEEVVETVKRGRGRPRKEVDSNAEIVVTEKRGRGRPRKEIDPNAIVEAGVKRGRGRPKKEVRFNLPSDLDDVIGDEEVEQLISGNTTQSIENNISSNDFVNDLVANNIEEADDMFDADYDLFKSNIRNILSGKEVTNQNYHTTTLKEETQTPDFTNFEQVNQFADIEENKELEEKVETLHSQATSNLYQFEQINKFKDIEDDEEDNIEYANVSEPSISQETDNQISTQENTIVEEPKRGRGRPRKEVDPNQVVEEGVKRGRGRPKKIVIEEVDDEREKRGRGRPRIEPINSLTRSLTPNSMPAHTNQDIVFASKNVTTTNININVTKTTTSVEDNKATSDDYSHTTNISQQKVEISIPSNISNDEEIEVNDDLESKQSNANEFDDEVEEDVDASHIKDEAPSGGIEDLLKALLDD